MKERKSGEQDQKVNKADQTTAEQQAMEQEPVEPQENQPDATNTKSAEENQGSASVPSAEDTLKELEKENAELKDQYLRKVADFDNYRKRMIKEKQEAFDYANTALLTDLIAILDDFDRALSAATEATDVKSITDGIKMINKQMKGLLEAKYNLSCYGVAGDHFDPHFHEALASTQADVAEPTCAEVYLKGYMLKDRVIRHAKVMVNMPANEKTENS